MATTYDPIASTTLTLPAISVTFSSLDTIAAGYRDLIIVIEAISPSSTGDNLSMEFNTDTTSSNYSYVYMAASAGGTASSATTGTFVGRVDTGKVLNILQVMDFSATDKHKSSLTRWNEREEYLGALATRWANTSAITRIDFKCSFGFAAGSTFSLYGIAA